MKTTHDIRQKLEAIKNINKDDKATIELIKRFEQCDVFTFKAALDECILRKKQNINRPINNIEERFKPF